MRGSGRTENVEKTAVAQQLKMPSCVCSARDLQGVKAVRSPPAVVRVIFDALLLLKQRPMHKIQVILPANTTL